MTGDGPEVLGVPAHVPGIAALVPDAAGRQRWGVYCNACSAQAGDYVWPCKAGREKDDPPAVLYADPGPPR